MIIRELAYKDRERQQQLLLSKSSGQLSRSGRPPLAAGDGQLTTSRSRHRLSGDQDMLLGRVSSGNRDAMKNPLAMGSQDQLLLLSSQPPCQLLRPSQLMSQKKRSSRSSSEDNSKPGFRPVVPRSSQSRLQRQMSENQISPPDYFPKRTFISVVETRVEATGDGQTPLER